MPFVPGHFRAPYLDVPTLRKQPPIFPEVTTDLFLDHLRFRQELLLRILPEPPETLRQHLLCFTAYSIPYLHILVYSAILRMGSPITILGVTTLPSCSRATSATSSTHALPRHPTSAQLCVLRMFLQPPRFWETSAFPRYLRFPTEPPHSHASSSVPGGSPLPEMLRRLHVMRYY
ncbi:hypothetical protein B0H12DRAFT_1242019 [Mycena haematopus]|nr:hypothetical protein B0H12DRAFT_1242019 [Mycena haematopus]